MVRDRSMNSKLLNDVAHCLDRDAKVFGDGLVPFRNTVFSDNSTSDALRYLSCLHHSLVKSSHVSTDNLSQVSLI